MKGARLYFSTDKIAFNSPNDRPQPPFYVVLDKSVFWSAATGVADQLYFERDRSRHVNTKTLIKVQGKYQPKLGLLISYHGRLH